MVNLTEWLHGQDLRGDDSSRRSRKLVPLLDGGSGSVVSEEWCSFSDDESDGTVNTDDEWEKEDGGEEEDLAWDDDFDGVSAFKGKGEDEEEDEEEGVWCGDNNDNTMVSPSKFPKPPPVVVGKSPRLKSRTLSRSLSRSQSGGNGDEKGEGGDERWEIVKDGDEGEWETL